MSEYQKKIKLVLVNVWSRPSKTPHFGLMSLAAFVKSNFTNLEIKIIEGTNPGQEILRTKPDLIGFTSDTLTFAKTHDLAQELRKTSQAPFIIGGVHITCLPQSFQHPFDLAVLGEGEITFLELLRHFEKNGKFLVADLKNIKGILFKDGNQIIKTEKRELIKNIDDLPVPARELVPMQEFYFKNQLNLFGVRRLASLMTSRGCPYHCVFCGSPAQWNGVRWHSPAYTVNQIKYLMTNYKVDGIMFWDDLFIAPKERLRLLVELIKKEAIEKQITFYGYARSNLIDAETCQLLKSINVKRLIFGFESGAPDILNYLKSNTVTIEDNIKTIKLCRQYKITTSSGFIIGTPGETVADLKKTYEFMKKYSLDNTQVYILTPYPGTLIWQAAEESGMVSDDMDFGRLYVQLPSPRLIDFFKIHKQDLLKGRVFLNPAYENDPAYLDLIFKIIKLAYWQNLFFYLKILPKNLRLVKELFYLKIKKLLNFRAKESICHYETA